MSKVDLPQDAVQTQVSFKVKSWRYNMDISYLFLANDSCDECTKTLPYHTDSLG